MADNHGNTPAAWTAVTIGLLGFVIGSVGMMLEPVNYIVFWIGVVVVLIAAVAFVVFSRLGSDPERH